MKQLWCVALLASCFAREPEAPVAPSYPLTGIVTGLKAGKVTVAHDDIEGLMPAMTMTLSVAEPSDLQGVEVGSQIAAQLVVPDGGGSHLREVRVVVAAKPADGVTAGWTKRGLVPIGETLPSTPVMVAHGEPVNLGAGQQGAWAVTFVYTRCPLPEFCPLVASKMAALQSALPAGSRALALTLDPDFDSRGVLRAYADRVGAEPGRWDMGRMPKHNLVALAERLGLEVSREQLAINHGLLLVLLGPDGRVLKRYPHMDWSVEEVVQELRQSMGNEAGRDVGD